MKMPYRVVIADDHPLARKAIRSILASDDTFQIVGEACNGEEAVSLCSELQPDLILMDIHMPKLNGLEATRQIKQAQSRIKIVILSVSDDIVDLFTAIQFGAQGYLLKNLDPDDWLNYLHNLLEDEKEVSRDLASRMLYLFRERDLPDSLGLHALTPRELEILVHVAHGETNRVLADKLGISENTAKNHIKNILSKLHLENRVQLASFAVKHGLMISGR